MAPPRRLPVLLGEVRAARLVLHIHCPICKHAAEVPAEVLPLPPNLDMNAVGHRMLCTGCGLRGGHRVFPDGRGWVLYLRATGQRDRVPWWGPMIRDEP